MSIWNRSILGLCFSILAAFPLRASADREETPAEGELPVYLIHSQSESETVAERLYLPSSLALYAWNSFRVNGSEIELEAQGGYRIVSREMVQLEKWDSRSVAGYHVRVSYYDRRQGGSGRILTVTFQYGASSDGAGEIRQPAARALLEAVRGSGRAGGMARLKEITYLGGGGFRARVEIR